MFSKIPLKLKLIFVESAIVYSLFLFFRRLQDQERLLNEREQVINNLKESMHDSLTNKQKKLTELQHFIEEMKINIQHLHWEKNDIVKENNMKIKRYVYLIGNCD